MVGKKISELTSQVEKSFQQQVNWGTAEEDINSLKAAIADGKNFVGIFNKLKGDLSGKGIKLLDMVVGGIDASREDGRKQIVELINTGVVDLVYDVCRNTPESVSILEEPWSKDTQLSTSLAERARVEFETLLFVSLNELNRAKARDTANIDKTLHRVASIVRACETFEARYQGYNPPPAAKSFERESLLELSKKLEDHTKTIGYKFRNLFAKIISFGKKESLEATQIKQEQKWIASRISPEQKEEVSPNPKMLDVPRI